MDPEEYRAYLVQKQRTDKVPSIGTEDKWRGWRFRNFCCRKSSEDKLVNRMNNKYGLLCKIYFRDWSSNFQQKGCIPAPTVGTRKLLGKWFETENMDEYRTSNGELTKYRNR